MYSVLENQALKKRGLNVFKSWQDGLHQYLGQRIKTSSASVRS
jgi:hypothetical protein